MNVTLNLSSTADKSPLGESAGYTYVYRSYFLKKLWCCIDGAVKEKNGLSTELIKSNYNPKEIEKTELLITRLAKAFISFFQLAMYGI